MKHPIQPLVIDSQGTRRFHANAIVRHLLEFGRQHGCGLNEIAGMEFSDDDRQQLAQLIGYSLDGYDELSYVDDKAFGAAALMAKGKPEQEARIQYLETELAEIRKGLREPVARLFGVHPDDLKRNG